MVPVQAVRRLVARMISDQRGVTAVEYGLIIGLIVIVMVVGLTSVADVTVGMWGNVSQKVVNAR